MIHVSAHIVWVIFAVSEISLALFKRSGAQARSNDGGSFWRVWITILLSLIGGYLAARLLPQFNLPARDTIYFVGVITGLFGLALRWYAILYLGRFFTVNVAIASDHRVIDTGPYKYVRHPSYTGVLLAFFGISLSCANLATLLIVMLPISWAFFRRIQWEETALLQALGPAYAKYSVRTKRLIPGVL